MTRIRFIFIALLYVMFAKSVRVYEDEVQALDIADNLNSTGPVLYPIQNRTQVPMLQNKTNMSSLKEVSENAEDLPMEKVNMAKPNGTEKNVLNSTAPDELRNKTNNRSLEITTRIKENSSLKARETYLHREQHQTANIQKPFISSPEVISSKMAQHHQVLAVDSFQPMDKPQISYPTGYHQFSQPQPRQRFQSFQQLSTNQRQEVKEQQPEYNSLHHYVHKEPQHYPHREHEHYSQKLPENYSPKEPQYYNPRDQQLQLQREQQYVQKDGNHFAQKQPQPIVESNLVAWPENNNHQYKELLSNDWTTEQPELQTHQIKYFQPPFAYEAPKHPSNTELATTPSIPHHPYPFEIFSRHPNSYFSSSDFQYPTTQNGPDDHLRDFEKYEIITTTPPDFQFSTEHPSTHHETKVARPQLHLPWHKIVKVLSAIIPIGLLVSALTPNVVLIDPNATNTKPTLPSDLYSFLTGRQRSLTSDRIFNEKLMGFVHDLNDQNPESLCVKLALCQVISSNATVDLTNDQYVDFRNKICKNNTNVSLDC